MVEDCVAIVLSPLMAFEVTVAVERVPARLGVRTTMPVAFPPDVVNVLIVFDVTMEVGVLPSHLNLMPL